MDTQVRRLQPGDEDAAARVAAAFKAAAVPSSRAAQFLANRANYLIVAEQGGGLVGFVLAYRLDRLDRETGQLFVYEVGALHEFQGRGVGTGLMQHVRRIVEDEALMEAFVLTAHRNTAAKRLYSRTGGQVEVDDDVLFVYPHQAA